MMLPMLWVTSTTAVSPFWEQMELIELYLHFSTPTIPSPHLLVRRLDQALQSVEVQTVLIRCSSEVIRRSVDVLSANVALEIFSLKHS